MKVKVFPLGYLYANCYVAWDETKECVIIDPGDGNAVVSNFILYNDLNVKYILCTHSHFDHVFGAGFFKSKYPSITIYVHYLDYPGWLLNKAFARQFYMKIPADYPAAPDKLFKDQDIFKIGNCELSVLLTPGHTPGSVCFLNKKEYIAFTGDTLFATGIGRVDFPGGSAEYMHDSIKLLKTELGDNYTVYPGHMEQAPSKTAIYYAYYMI